MTNDVLIKLARYALKDETKKPNSVLTKTYSMLFGFRKDIYGIVGKLLKHYEPKVILESIESLYDSGKNPEKNLYGQLVGICYGIKKNNENNSVSILKDLTDYLKGTV